MQIGPASHPSQPCPAVCHWSDTGRSRALRLVTNVRSAGAPACSPLADDKDTKPAGPPSPSEQQGPPSLTPVVSLFPQVQGPIVDKATPSQAGKLVQPPTVQVQPQITS